MDKNTERHNIDSANTEVKPKQSAPLKRLAVIAVAVIVSPFLLVLLIAAALYIPAVQNWAVHTAGRYASEATGMDVNVESVHLAFPLDLSLEGVHCYKPNDSIPGRQDTIAEIRKAVVDVQFMPLLDNEVKVNEMELLQANVNTADFIPSARIKGSVGRLGLDVAHGTVADVSLERSMVNLSSAFLDKAHLNIELSDTVPEDTSKTENLWRIHLDDLHVTKSDVLLHMPGDTLQIGVTLDDAKAHMGDFDLHRGLYRLATLALTECELTYDNNFAARAATGLDVNHIALSNIRLRVDSLSYWMGDTLLPGNQGNMTARLNIRECSMKERSGIVLQRLNGIVDLDTTCLNMWASLATPGSRMMTKLVMDLNTFDYKDPGRLSALLDASIGYNDLMTFGGPYLPRNVKGAWPMQPLIIKGEAEGNMKDVDIRNLLLELPTAFALDARGTAKGFMALADDPYSRDFNARMHADLKTYNMSFVKAFLDRSTAKMINIPSMHAVADVTANGADYDVALTATEGRGNVKADAKVNIAAMRYNASVAANALNIGHFVKGMGLGTFTGSLKAHGQGTDMLKKSTTLDAKAEVTHFAYQKYNLNNIKAEAAIKDGKADASVVSRNQLLNANLRLGALMSTKELKATVVGDVGRADLYNMMLVDAPLAFSLCGHVDVESDMKEFLKVQGLVSDIHLSDSARVFSPDDIVVDVLTQSDTTAAHIYCGDFETRLHASGGYRWLIGSSDKLMAEVKRQMHERTIDQTALRELMPRISLYLTSGNENPIARTIKYMGVDFSKVYVDMNTSQEKGINGKMQLYGLASQGVKLDTIDVALKTTNDPNDISYRGRIRNVAPNDYVFDALFDGNLLEHGISLNGRLFDNKHAEALRLGAEATMEEDGIKLHLTPKRPILGYQEFALNKDNYVLLALNNRIHADVNLLADDGTGIKIYCTDNDSDDEETKVLTEDGEDIAVESIDKSLQDLTLSINKLNIGKVIAVIPYAPKVEGMLDGDFHFVQNTDESFAVSANANINKLKYEGCNIGNLGTEMVYMPLADGSHSIDGFLTMDDKEIADIKGSYNMDTEAINAVVKCDNFPLMIANGFIPDQIIGLEGTADGELTVSGTTTIPMVNGELFLQDASLLSVPYGVKMRFDDDPVRIQNSQLLLENFQMYAPNDQPLVCMGSIDFSNTEHIKTDLRLRAKNFQIIDAKQTRRSEAYGKAFVNFFCRMSGELDKLQVRGKLDVLPSTDLYYILNDSPLTTDNRLKELVTFTDFADTTQVVTNRPVVEGMAVDLTIGINEGVHATCWLNANHTNYLDVIGGGELRMNYTTEDLKMKGRYTIREGEMKYALPIIPLKTFTIAPDSYIEFTGDVMNPKLNITATEQVKSNVTLEELNVKEQIIPFECGVVITKTLNDMGLQFIVNALENQSISDFLSMKSAEERGKIAVTMLTTGMFLTDGNTSAFSMNSALNTFLQSEINRIAGSALRTMDLSFGMDNSTEEDGTMHTNYTFKFAKRFWNNRISISIGGKVSTGPDVSGQNKSFFDNAELQYRMSDTSNQYLHMNYKYSVYDYLEGYVSQYSGGYMYKRKMQQLKELIFPNTPSPIVTEQISRQTTNDSTRMARQRGTDGNGRTTETKEISSDKK